MVDYEARRAPELLWTAQWPAGQMWTEGEEQRLSLFFKSNFKSCEGARPNSEFLFFNYLKVRVQALFPKNGCHFLANNIWKWWDTVIRKLWTSLYCCDQTPQHFSEGGNSLRIAKYLPKGDWDKLWTSQPNHFSERPSVVALQSSIHKMNQQQSSFFPSSSCVPFLEVWSHFD